jgi:transcriptional regulator with XRE-family HTH domain
MTFGEWLQTEIGRRDDLSIRKFAKAIGVSHATVGKWIAGTDYPRRFRVPAIAGALGMTENAIWDALREGGEESDDALKIIAREVPESTTPHEARLIATLLRGIVRSLHEWEEDEADRSAAMLGEVPVSVEAVRRVRDA